MNFRETKIQGLWVIESPVHEDIRGSFKEWFKFERNIESLGLEFQVKQANTSVSRKGVVRGVHFSTSNYKQDKIVSCSHGSITDIITDIRLGSPTFGESEYIYLNGKNGISVYISAGLGHSFISLEDFSVVTYLLTSEYDSKSEFGVNPLDKDLGLDLKFENIILSEKDRNAFGLSYLRDRNLLPIFK